MFTYRKKRASRESSWNYKEESRWWVESSSLWDQKDMTRNKVEEFTLGKRSISTDIQKEKGKSAKG